MHGQMTQAKLTEPAVQNVFEADDLHIPHLLMGAVVADLYKRRLHQDMRASDFDKPVVLRVLERVPPQDILFIGRSMYVHGEPVQAHYRWMKRDEVIERKLFGPEPGQLMGRRTEFVQIPDTPFFVEEMMYGEEVLWHGRLERRMVLNALCVGLCKD